MADAEPDTETTGRQQEDRARRLALAAERSAYAEARRLGLLDEEDLREVSARIDSELESEPGQPTGGDGAPAP